MFKTENKQTNQPTIKHATEMHGILGTYPQGTQRLRPIEGCRLPKIQFCAFNAELSLSLLFPGKAWVDLRKYFA